VLLLASLGILVCTQNAISLLFGDATRRIYGGFDTNSILILGAHISKIQVITICVSWVLAIILLLWEQGTRMGLLLRAVANDSELSIIVGVNSNRVMVVAFALGSALVAIGAILAAFDTDLVPAMGFRAILMGVVAALVGGMESSLGAFLGGFILGVTQNYAAWVVPAQWQDGIVFSLLILLLLVRPTGLLGSPARKANL
jgi:branched-subunit amino acid ABC-type transport system permease component